DMAEQHPPLASLFVRTNVSHREAPSSSRCCSCQRTKIPKLDHDHLSPDLDHRGRNRRRWRKACREVEERALRSRFVPGEQRTIGRNGESHLFDGVAPLGIITEAAPEDTSMPVRAKNTPLPEHGEAIAAQASAFSASRLAMCKHEPIHAIVQHHATYGIHS